MPVRVLDAGLPIETDFGEQVLTDCEEATGQRPRGCPWWALSDPFVTETIDAHRWWSKGALDVRYPLGIPAWLSWSITTYDAALNAVQVHDMRADREEREREMAARRLERETQERTRPR